MESVFQVGIRVKAVRSGLSSDACSFFPGNSVYQMLLDLSGKLQEWLFDFLLLLFCSKGQKLKKRDYSHTTPRRMPMANQKIPSNLSFEEKVQKGWCLSIYLLCSILCNLKDATTELLNNEEHSSFISYPELRVKELTIYIANMF